MSSRNTTPTPNSSTAAATPTINNNTANAPSITSAATTSATTGNASKRYFQGLSAELSPRHFLAFHNSVSRLQRIKFQLSITASLDNDENDNEENSKAQQQPILCGFENCEIRMITDPAHPAFRQCGLFAAQKISAGALIMPYAGLVTLVGTIPSSQTYIMSYGGEDSDLGIDAEYFGNFARFANDPRGTGLGSNAFAVMKPTRLGEMFTALLAKRTIMEGEEILLDYGKRHRLSKVPLISRKGTLLTHARPVIPFKRNGEEENPLSSRDASNVFPLLSSSSSSSKDNTNMKKNQNQSNQDSSSSSTTIARTIWQCLQCGAWNDGGDLQKCPWTIAVVCTTCQQPRSNDTVPAVALVEVAKELRTEKSKDGENSRRIRDRPEEEDEEDSNNNTKNKISSSSTTLPDTPSEGVHSPTFTIQRCTVSDEMMGETRVNEGTATMTREECSIPASWPLNFPFISWQVWDPEVSIFAVNGNSKIFVPQSSLVVLEIEVQQQQQNQTQKDTSDNDDENVNQNTNDDETLLWDNDDDDDEKFDSAIRGVFSNDGAKKDEEIGVVGGLLVDKMWSCHGEDRLQRFLGFSGQQKDWVYKFNAAVTEHEDDDDDEEFEEVEEEYEEEIDDDDDSDESDDEVQAEQEDNTEKISSLLDYTGAFVAPFFILNLRHLRVTHRDVVHLPGGELDAIPTAVKLPLPPNTNSYLGDKFLDMYFYPTNEAQHLRVASPRMRRRKLKEFNKKMMMMKKNGNNNSKSTTRTYLPREAFEYVPECSYVVEDVMPNATLELVRDPVGFIYVAIVAVEDNLISRFSEIVI